MFTAVGLCGLQIITGAHFARFKELKSFLAWSRWAVRWLEAICVNGVLSVELGISGMGDPLLECTRGGAGGGVGL